MKEEKSIIYFKERENQYVISSTETLEDAIEFVSKSLIDKYYDGSIENYINENICQGTEIKEVWY